MHRLTVMLVLSLNLAAQTAVPTPPPDSGNNLPAQMIGSNDLLNISVYDAPELTRTVRVGADGYIRLPMLVQHVKAEGLMPAELEAAVSEALERGKILRDPYVTVTVAEYHSRPISVAGAVKQPLTFQAIGNVTLLEAITRAGGLSPQAGPEILVSRAAVGDEPALEQRVGVKALFDSSDSEANILLSGGEEVRVPDLGRVYVVGNVKKPGAFPIQDTTDSTVLKALALSEGLQPFASKVAYIYRREGGEGGKNEIPVNLRQIIDRKSPDVALLPNDIFYVPDDRTRRASMNALEKILSFGAGTLSGVLVYSTIH